MKSYGDRSGKEGICLECSNNYLKKAPHGCIRNYIEGFSKAKKKHERRKGSNQASAGRVFLEEIDIFMKSFLDDLAGDKQVEQNSPLNTDVPYKVVVCPHSSSEGSDS